MFETIEVRVIREEQLGGEWADIEPLTFHAPTEQVAEIIAGQIAQADEVYMVRWNWGGQVAGLGQGHYIHGPALKRRYRLGGDDA